MLAILNLVPERKMARIVMNSSNSMRPESFLSSSRVTSLHRTAMACGGGVGERDDIVT
jgi:hypothetical protein